MMMIYSNSLHHLKIVQSAFYACRDFTQVGDISRVAEKTFAVDVSMHPFMIIMVIRLKRNAPFAEV